MMMRAPKARVHGFFEGSQDIWIKKKSSRDSPGEAGVHLLLTSAFLARGQSKALVFLVTGISAWAGTCP